MRFSPILLLRSIVALTMVLATPALAWRDEGGYTAAYAQQVWSHHGPKRIGWFYSAAHLWLGNPGACVDSGSMVHIHPVTDRLQGRGVPFDNAWNYIVPETTPFDSRGHSVKSVLSQTPWGARVYRAARAAGCYSHPDGCNFYGDQLASEFGVPRCRPGVE